MIRKIKSGETITAKWLNTLVDAIKSLQPVAGEGIKVSKTAQGTIIKADGKRKNKTSQASVVDSTIFPCEVYSHDDFGYYIDIYARGFGSDPTEEGYMMLPDISTRATIPNGTKMLCVKITTNYIGGNDTLNGEE